MEIYRIVAYVAILVSVILLAVAYANVSKAEKAKANTKAVVLNLNPLKSVQKPPSASICAPKFTKCGKINKNGPYVNCCDKTQQCVLQPGTEVGTCVSA